LNGTPGPVAATPAASPPMAATLGANVAVDQRYAQVYEADCTPTVDAVQSTLAAAQEPVASVDPARGLIQTESIPVDNAELQSIVAPQDASSVGQQDGRYVLAFQVRCESTGDANAPARSVVATAAQIIINNPNTANVLGGFPAMSNGTLETQHLEEIAKAVKPVTPNLAVTINSTAPETPVNNINDLPIQSSTGARVVVAPNVEAVIPITEDVSFVPYDSID
jgi:hypothetical protein